MLNPELQRLEEENSRKRNWKRWGPYLSDRQWATVREDYSKEGNSWNYFPHEHARSRAYRWGEDGLLGISDRECRLCFSLGLWNGKDRILKERLFGLTGPEGNHGEDVKELYFYLDSTPTHSYLKGLYKYPQNEYPYQELISKNQAFGLEAPEFEITDTKIFDNNEYFDIFVEYAKASPEDILIEITVINQDTNSRILHLLPQVWYRNTWGWDSPNELRITKPTIAQKNENTLTLKHETLGEYELYFSQNPLNTQYPQILFCENETNAPKLYASPASITGKAPLFKDGVNEYVVNGNREAISYSGPTTKSALHYLMICPPQEEIKIQLRLKNIQESPAEAAQHKRAEEISTDLLSDDFTEIFDHRRLECEEYYNHIIPQNIKEEDKVISRQAYAGLFWSKQFYHFIIKDWLEGDATQSPPPPERKSVRNYQWAHLFSRDIISMPDKWEYPWFAAWDLAFHMLPFAKSDPTFAKQQLILFLREWYMHPNGQIPAYEFNFSNVNPPVHAWAAWRVYKISAKRGERDRRFLESVFQKLLLNFTWWVNRTDAEGNNLFSGGFLGLDNIGVFDRSRPLPTGGYLQQADGTAWMAFYSLTMLSIALELAQENPVYEDLASKFFEHFVAISFAMNTLGGTGLWDEPDGFYYDQIRVNHQTIPLKTRSLVGLMPIIAVEVLEEAQLAKTPNFLKRMQWFMKHYPELVKASSVCEQNPLGTLRILAIPSFDRLEKVLKYMLCETEFLSEYGLRSVSKFHDKNPYIFKLGNEEHSVKYVPGESNSLQFGGNSNWRGPIWFPTNYLLIEALERYYHFFGPGVLIEYPTNSGKKMNLLEISKELSRRLTSLFQFDNDGFRPAHGDYSKFSKNSEDTNSWKDLILFYEYFNAENGKGLGASHQTGWTALVTNLIDKLHKERYL